MTFMARAALLARGGPNEGSSVPLADGMTIMGRAPLNEVVVDEPGVSRQHAAIRGDADAFWISDLGSRNGTFVNGSKIGQEPQRLRNWDRIQFGGMPGHWVFMESEETVAVASVEATVTIMFTDIVGSTAITERLGDAQARELLRLHDEIVKQHANAQGGTVVKSTGDGTMLTFPSAGRGVACAAAVQRELAQRRREIPGLPLQVRVGLSVGEPVREEQDIFGMSVNLAARICAQAQGGQVLVSQIVRELAATTGEFAFREAGPFELKGISGAQSLYEVLWEGS